MYFLCSYVLLEPEKYYPELNPGFVHAALILFRVSLHLCIRLHSPAGHVGKHLTNICILRSKLSVQYSITKHIFKPTLLQCNLQ